MVALSANGAHIWSRIYQSPTGDDNLVGIVPVQHDKWLLLGATDGYGANNKRVWVNQVDYSGSIIWSKTYAVSDEDYASFSATALLGGDVLVCVNRPDASFGTKSILLKINSAGDILSNTRYRTFWGEKDVLYEAIPNQSGGLWAVGSANRNGLPDIWLVKTKTDGGIAGCCPSVYDMDQQAVIISSDVISLNPVLGATPFAGKLKEQAQVLTEINACEQVNLSFTLSQDTLCIGDCITVDFPNPTPGIQYSWLFQNGNPSSSNQTQPDGAFCFADEGFVTLKTNNVYCGQQDASVRVVFKQNQGQAPNVFSPNGDGINDTFRPLFNDCPAENYHFQVFNRWGEMVFDSLDATQGWDGVNPNGRNAAADIYVWRAAYWAIRDGRKTMVEDKGDVLLLR
jgi:gliding motility-associated-like protein